MNTAGASDLPSDVAPVDGIVHCRGSHNVEDTVMRLSAAIGQAGAKVFVIIDQAAEASAARLALRPTQLIVFGSPRAGTRLMEAVPLSALDLPLKLLVWQATDGQTWISYLSGKWLAVRYGIPSDIAHALSSPDNLARQATA